MTSANLEGLWQLRPPRDISVPRRALVIAAHPDDADFGAGGTAWLWSRLGWQFTFLICTNGAKGTNDPSMAPSALIKLRRREQRAAAAILGVRDCVFLDYEDGELEANRGFLAAVVEQIRRLKPDVIFTHDHESVIVGDAFVNHSDHRATGLTVVDAVYPAARDRLNFPEQIAAGLEPHKVAEVYIWGSERANYEVDITDVIEAKLNALRAHVSQFPAGFFDEARERWRRPDGRFYETFRRVTLPE